MLAIESQPTEEVNVALLNRCVSNDPDACNELFARYNRRIFNTAYRILGEEASAEDALQETLLNVYRGISNFRGDSKVSTWISRITINVCLGMLRKGGKVTGSMLSWKTNLPVSCRLSLRLLPTRLPIPLSKSCARLLG